MRKKAIIMKIKVLYGQHFFILLISRVLLRSKVGLDEKVEKMVIARVKD